MLKVVRVWTGTQSPQATCKLICQGSLCVRGQQTTLQRVCGGQMRGQTSADVCVCVVFFREGQMRGQGGPLWADHLSLQSTGLHLPAASC